VASFDVASSTWRARPAAGVDVGDGAPLRAALGHGQLPAVAPLFPVAAHRRTGAYTRARRAQLEQLKDTFRVKLGHTVNRGAQVELKSEGV
jgi:hypothetical protein